MNGITITEGKRGEYVRALGPASRDHARLDPFGWLRSKKQQLDGESVWAIGRNRPHATEQGQPFFVLFGEDRQSQTVTLRLLSTSRSALSRKCSMFDAKVVKRVVIEPHADPEDVARVALELQAEAEELEMCSHLQAQARKADRLADDPVSDHLLMARAALKA